MSILRKLFPIGSVFLGVCFLLAPGAQAIYSPTLALRAGQIRENILASQAQNGSGSLLSIAETIANQQRLARKEGKATGLSGSAAKARNRVLADAAQQAALEPFDSLTLVFNYIASTNEQVSNCLRNDIWELEALKNKVAQEMVKAYMVNDSLHGDLLEKDYNILVSDIELLKSKGAHPQLSLLDYKEKNGQLEPTLVTVNEYLFGHKDATNYYLPSFPSGENGCPEGDFDKAFQQVIRSAQSLAAMSAGKSANWGSIWEMAQARAKQRASQWIAANQISLTIGGEAGGLQQSLVKGGGWDQFAGQAETQFRVLKNMIGPVTPLFSWTLYETAGEAVAVAFGKDVRILSDNCAYYYPEDNVFRPCTQEQKKAKLVCDGEDEEVKRDLRCDRLVNTRAVESITEKYARLGARQKQNAVAQKEAEIAFAYHLNLESVGEENLKALDKVMFEINGEAKRAIEAVDPAAGLSLPTMKKGMEQFYQQHCENKPKS